MDVRKRDVDMRRFGIDIVGDVPWGTHFCQFYQNKEDLKDILVPYFAEGLRNNEFCMWITSLPLEVKEAKEALEKAVPDLDDCLKKGQIEILSHTDWYVIDGEFEADKVLEGWVKKEKKALSRGFAGLRLSGNTFWIERNGWKSFVDYEAKINEVIGFHKMIALCTYSLQRCTGTHVVDVVKNHAGTLIRKGEIWYLVEDVAQRRRIENELVQSESRYHSLFANMSSGFGYHKVLFDDAGKPLDYVFLDVNDAFETLTGLKREEIIGKKVTDVFRGGGKAVDSLIEACGKVATTEEAAKFDYYFDPLQKWYQIGAYCPEKGHFAAIFSDITAQKRMEDELKSLARFPFENPHAILRVDSSGIVSYCNPECQRSFKGVINAVGQRVPDRWCQYTKNTLSSNNRLEFEERIDGRTYSFEMVPFSSENYVNIYGVDITERKDTEQALRDSEERFRVIAQTIPIQISVSRASDGTILFTNPAYDRAFGFPEGELVGMKAPDLYCDPADRVALFGALKKRGFLQNYESKVKRTDGTPFWVSASVCKINFAGEPAILGASLDVTERKRTEAALYETQRDLSRAQSVAKTGSWRLDVQKNILLWSDETYRIFGIPKGTPLTYETFLKIVFLDDREYVDQKWKAALAGQGYDVEHRIVIGKEVKWVRETAELEFSEDKVLLGGFGTVQEITQFKEMQAKLEEYSENLEKLVEERTRKLELGSLYARSLIEASPDPLVTINAEGKITDTNRATELATGRSRSHLIGSDFSDCFTEPEKARIGYRKIFAEGFVRDYPLAIRHTSGKTTQVLYNASVFRNAEGEIQGVFAAARDVTELKKAEKRAQESVKKLKDAERLAAIGATAGMIGHDIRNPLQSIIGNIDLLKIDLDSVPESPNKDDMHECLEDLEKQADYVNKIIADLQDYTRPLKPIFEEIDLQIIIDDILLHLKIPGNIKAQICIESGARKILSDPAHLRRVLGNLISNAVQAMPEGGKLTIHAHQESEDVIVSIEDTGQGIPEEYREKLFQPLFTTKSKGQGFGLAAAKRLIEASKGTITYESQEGKGTRFIVRLPNKKT